MKYLFLAETNVGIKHPSRDHCALLDMPVKVPLAMLN
jgi:hypothetical protein